MGGDPSAFAAAQFALDDAEEGDILPAQERRARPERGELLDGAFLCQHVRHAHPVECALDHGLRGVEVGVRVQVDESRRVLPAHPSCQHAEEDGAVAAEDERHVSAGDDRFHLVGQRPGDLCDAGDVLRVAVLAVDRERTQGQVAV